MSLAYLHDFSKIWGCYGRDENCTEYPQLWFNYFAGSFFKALDINFSKEAKWRNSSMVGVRNSFMIQDFEHFRSEFFTACSL